MTLRDAQKLNMKGRKTLEMALIMRIAITAPNVSAVKGAFPRAILFGNRLFRAGQVLVDPATLGCVTGDLEVQPIPGSPRPHRAPPCRSRARQLGLSKSLPLPETDYDASYPRI